MAMEGFDDTTVSIFEAANITAEMLPSFTREDWKDLLPGPEHFLRRKRIWDSLHPEESSTSGTAAKRMSPPKTSSPHTSTQTLTPQKILKISSPEYVIYTDAELNQVRLYYKELKRAAREDECIMSKELRCRLIRNTITNMISLVRAGEMDAEYPSRDDLSAMAKRLVEYYPMLRDKASKKKTWDTVFRQMLKRLQNVKSSTSTPVARRRSNQTLTKLLQSNDAEDTDLESEETMDDSEDTIDYSDCSDSGCSSKEMVPVGHQKTPLQTAKSGPQMMSPPSGMRRSDQTRKHNKTRQLLQPNHDTNDTDLDAGQETPSGNDGSDPGCSSKEMVPVGHQKTPLQTAKSGPQMMSPPSGMRRSDQTQKHNKTRRQLLPPNHDTNDTDLDAGQETPSGNDGSEPGCSSKEMVPVGHQKTPLQIPKSGSQLMSPPSGMRRSDQTRKHNKTRQLLQPNHDTNDTDLDAGQETPSGNDGSDPGSDSRLVQARHHKTLLELWKRPKHNPEDVAHLLDLEFEARRDFIQAFSSKEEDRTQMILNGYPCFRDPRHIMEEMGRLIESKNKNFIAEMKLRWTTFCKNAAFFGMWNKSMQPPMGLDETQQAMALWEALPKMFTSPTAPHKKLGNASEALFHVLEPSEDPSSFLKKRPIGSPVILIDKNILVAVGTTPVLTLNMDYAEVAPLIVMACYYAFELTYPKCLSTLLSVIQTEVLNDAIHESDMTPSYKKAIADWKTFTKK